MLLLAKRQFTYWEFLIQVLDTLSKNCGEYIFQQIVERDILHDMVKIVKKKVPISVFLSHLKILFFRSDSVYGPF